MAYLRDILARKPNIKDALLEYNGGPTSRRLHYYRMVMGTYGELLERPELRCLYQPAQEPPAVLALLTRASTPTAPARARGPPRGRGPRPRPPRPPRLSRHGPPRP